MARNNEHVPEQATYTIWVKSQTWTPEGGIGELDFAIEGLGNNVQLRLGMPGREPVMPNDQPPAMRLPTGEWISFRGKFAEAEPAARSIVEEAQEQLTLIARDAREGGWDAVVKRRFTVTGPTLKS